jgi:hypothetical protein
MLAELSFRPSRLLLCRKKRLYQGQTLTRRFVFDACTGTQAHRQARSMPFGSGFAGHYLFKYRKTKSTPAHQGKFTSAPPSPCASAYAAHSVKGRYAFRSASLHSTLDFLPLLRPSLHTTAAPRKIFPQARRYKKAENPRTAFAPCLSSLFPFTSPCFSGAPSPLVSGGPDAFPASDMLFPPPRLMLSGSGAFACPTRCISFPHACLFVRRHPGGPAYVSCTRADARHTSRLARGCHPFEPRQSQRPKP